MFALLKIMDWMMIERIRHFGGAGTSQWSCAVHWALSLFSLLEAQLIIGLLFQFGSKSRFMAIEHWVILADPDCLRGPCVGPPFLSLCPFRLSAAKKEMYFLCQFANIQESLDCRDKGFRWFDLSLTLSRQCSPTPCSVHKNTTFQLHAFKIFCFNLKMHESEYSVTAYFVIQP